MVIAFVDDNTEAWLYTLNATVTYSKTLQYIPTAVCLAMSQMAHEANVVIILIVVQLESFPSTHLKLTSPSAGIFAKCFSHG